MGLGSKQRELLDPWVASVLDTEARLCSRLMGLYT